MVAPVPPSGNNSTAPALLTPLMCMCGCGCECVCGGVVGGGVPQWVVVLGPPTSVGSVGRVYRLSEWCLRPQPMAWGIVWFGVRAAAVVARGGWVCQCAAVDGGLLWGPWWWVCNEHGWWGGGDTSRQQAGRHTPLGVCGGFFHWGILVCPCPPGLPCRRPPRVQAEVTGLQDSCGLLPRQARRWGSRRPAPPLACCLVNAVGRPPPPLLLLRRLCYGRWREC